MRWRRAGLRSLTHTRSTRLQEREEAKDDGWLSPLRPTRSRHLRHAGRLAACSLTKLRAPLALAAVATVRLCAERLRCGEELMKE